MGWQKLKWQRVKTQMATKRRMSGMIPNISKWKWLTRIKLRLYCCPTTTQEKPKLLSSTAAWNIRNSSVACSKAILLSLFYFTTFRKLRYLYKFPFQKIVTWVNWGYVKISYLLHDLISDNRTIQWKKIFVNMISEIN